MSIPAIIHDAVLDWPNGLGYTPVTREYADLTHAKNAIHVPNNDYGKSLDDLSPEDYQRYNVIDNQLLTLQANGHCGKSERY